MAKVLLWGTGQIAQVTLHYLENDSDHDVCAFCLDREYIGNDISFHGKPIVAFDEIFNKYPPSTYKMAIPMGYKRLNRYREEKYIAAKKLGYEFITYVSSKSNCDAASVGENTFIFNFNDIQPYTQIGNNVMIWANTGVGHHAVIEDNCFLASPKVSGATTVKRNTFLGTNATVADSIVIGEYCVIGAGAIVTKNVADGSILAVKQTVTLPMKSFEIEDILG